MKDCYHIKHSVLEVSVADVMMLTTGVGLVTRINVAKEQRGKGHGSALLKQVTADADRQGIKLAIAYSAYPDSPLTNTDLRRWYERHGFKETKSFMEREPKK